MLKFDKDDLCDLLNPEPGLNVPADFTFQIIDSMEDNKK